MIEINDLIARRNEAQASNQRWICSVGEISFLYKSGERNFRLAAMAIRNLKGVDMRHADLRKADLQGANLAAADLQAADLRRADLNLANLWDADLRGTNLRHADLRNANLANADLRGADLRGADLRGANLRGANLRGAKMEGAKMEGARGYGEVYLPGMSSRGDSLRAVAGHAGVEGGVMFKTGCAWLTRSELLEKIQQEKSGRALEMYKKSVEFLYSYLKNV